MPSEQMLFAEADRQLSEQRAQADAFATRSGLMTAATALLTGLLASDISTPTHVGPLMWVIGSAAIFGILVLSMSRLMLGPSPSALSRWSEAHDPSALMKAKVLTIEANARALVRTELTFGLQALLTVGGIFLLIIRIGGLSV